jgi:hypothetical protein
MGSAEGKEKRKIVEREEKKRLKLKNHKNKFTFDLNNEHPKLLVFTHSMLLLRFFIFTAFINQVFGTLAGRCEKAILLNHLGRHANCVFVQLQIAPFLCDFA